tara:strand:- start:1954 stop:2346 length:393 start_codon:yes stop_codon:yes gene_type:complete
MAMPPRPMPPMGGAPNTPPMGGPPMGGAMPPPVNPPTNRLDSLMGAAGPVTGMGGPTPMPEDPMMGEEEGLMPQDVAVGVAEAVVSNTANLEDALATLDMAREQILSQMDSGPAMGDDAGRIEDMLAGLV